MSGGEVMVDERMVELFPDVAAYVDPRGFHYLVSPSQAPRVGGNVLVEVGGSLVWGRVVRVRGGELMVDTYGPRGLVYAQEAVVVVGLVTVGGATVPDPRLQGSFADMPQTAPDGPGATE